MLILVTYDISTMDIFGKKRLNKVAKYCLNYGQRVQNSVFECDLDYSQFSIFKNGLLKLINKEKDSIRIYNLGKNYHSKIEHYGTKESYETDGFIFI